MVQVCEGQKTKAEMLAENIEMYKDMYMRIKRELNRVITVRAFACHLCISVHVHCRV